MSASLWSQRGKSTHRSTGGKIWIIRHAAIRDTKEHKPIFLLQEFTSDLRELGVIVVSLRPLECFLKPFPVTVCREDWSKVPCRHAVTVVTTDSLCTLAFLAACRQWPVTFRVNTGAKACHGRACDPDRGFPTWHNCSYTQRSQADPTSTRSCLNKQWSNIHCILCGTQHRLCGIQCFVLYRLHNYSIIKHFTDCLFITDCFNFNDFRHQHIFPCSIGLFWCVLNINSYLVIRIIEKSFFFCIFKLLFNLIGWKICHKVKKNGWPEQYPNKQNRVSLAWISGIFKLMIYKS